MKRYIKAYNLIMAIILIALTVGCGTRSGDEDIPLIEGSADDPALYEIGYDTIEEMDVYDGEVSNYMTVLGFSKKGRFEKYNVNVGDKVTKGTVIATTYNDSEDEIKELRKKITLMETEYSNAVTNFELQLATNEWRVGQLRAMVESMDSSMDNFDSVCVSFELMMAEGSRINLEKEQYIEYHSKEIEYQKTKLGSLVAKSSSNTIIAPCDGVITYLKDLKAGENVSGAENIGMMTDNGELLIKCDYLSKDLIEEKQRIYACKDGKEYELTHYEYPKEDYEYRSSHGEKVYSYFTLANADESIHLSDSVTVIMDKNVRNNVIVVPLDCLIYDGGQNFVYKYEAGTRVLTPVIVGIKDRINAEIIEGLNAGDFVYASN